MPARSEKFASLKVHVTLEGVQVATVDGCLDLKGRPSSSVRDMAPEVVNGLVRATILKLIPSLNVRPAEAEAVRKKILAIVEREEARDAERKADEEVIVVEADEEDAEE